MKTMILVLVTFLNGSNAFCAAPTPFLSGVTAQYFYGILNGKDVVVNAANTEKALVLDQKSQTVIDCQLPQLPKVQTAQCTIQNSIEPVSSNTYLYCGSGHLLTLDGAAAKALYDNISAWTPQYKNYFTTGFSNEKCDVPAALGIAYLPSEGTLTFSDESGRVACDCNGG